MSKTAVYILPLLSKTDISDGGTGEESEMSDDENIVKVSHLSTTQSHLEQVVKINELAWNQDLGADEIRSRVQTLRELIEGSSPQEGCLLIAVRNGETVGFARATHRAEEGSPWMFSHLVVHPDYQRHGIATELCKACMAHAKANGATVLLSETHLDNVRSIAFHNAFGFRNDGVYEDSDGDKKVQYSYPLPS